jgi:transcriptional regulator with XRE-family HTH domain
MAPGEDAAHNASVALGQALRAMRKESGLSQEAVAALIDVPQNYISRWETAAWTLPLTEANRIEAALGRPKGYVLVHAGYVDEALLRADAAMENMERRRPSRRKP